MNSRNTWSRHATWFTAAWVLFASGSCSLLYDFNISQCNTDPDCTSKGPQFAWSVCQNHVCVQTVPGTGGGNSAGGQSSPSTGGGGAQGGQDQGGSNSTGGTPGTGGTPACVNADCMAAHTDTTYTCINGNCVPLVTSDCPVLIPTITQGSTALDLLQQPSPIILGGFASMTNAANQHDTYAIINWDLAFNEFNQQTSNGLPSYDGSGASRPLVGLICNGNNATPTTVQSMMQHLAQDIRVPGILTTLNATNLLAAFNYTTSTDYTNAGGNPVFFMSTSSANVALTDLNDNGMVWQVLGNSRQLAATTAGLIARIEPVVNAARLAYFNANGGPDNPTQANSLRVTLVTSSDPTMIDISNVLLSDSGHPETLLTFNGALATDPANNGYFRQDNIDSSTQTANPVVTNATSDLENNPPHIIIGMATAEFPKLVMTAVENLWASKAPNQMRPFYVLSHLLYNSPDLQTTLKNQNPNTVPQIDARLLGVNYAQTLDAHSQGLYNAYLNRLQASYPSTGALYSTLGGTENMYDGAYYLLYSAAAAAVNRRPSNPFSGTEIYSGLTSKVINPGATSQDIGPVNIAGIVSQMNQLGSGTPFAMSLWATMGPPNFDFSTGTRNSATSAWCIQYDTTVTPNAWTYEADGLLYNSSNSTFLAPSSGVPACLQNY